MKKILPVVLVLAVAALSGCNKYVVRNQQVYLTEVQFTDKLVQSAADAIHSLWGGKCACVEGEWGAAPGSDVTDAQCVEAADVYLMVSGNRWAWHSTMSLINAGWEQGEIENLPEGFNPEAPPEIPPLASLCAGGE